MRAAQQRDWLEAWRCWDAVRLSCPDYSQAYLGAGEALRETGRYDDAELCLSTAAERFPQDEQIAVAHASLANARRDWTTALSRWDDVRTRFPYNPLCYLGAVHALRSSKRLDQVEALLLQAETVLPTVKQRALDAAAVRRLEFEIAKVRVNWPAVRQCAEEIVASEAVPSADIFLGLAQACWHLGDPEAADGAAQRAVSADPALADAVLLRVRIATERGDGETALSCYRRLVELYPGSVRWSLKLVQMLDWLGRVKESVSELDRICRQWPNDPMVINFLDYHKVESSVGPGLVRGLGTPMEGETNQGAPTIRSLPHDVVVEEIRAVAHKAPPEAERLRALFVADLKCDALIAQVPGAETGVLIFTGARDEVSMPLRLFDRYLATLSVTAIYLKDFNRLRYLSGIQSLGNDYQSTIAALRDMLNRLGVKRLCTLGNCVGGFAAIRYGVELGADRIVAFGPPTHNPPESLLAKGEEGRNFMRSRLDSRFSRDMTDLRLFLETRRHSCLIDLFYGEDAPRQMHALRLKGLPGITMHPEPELNDHLLRRLAFSTRDFRGMLGQLLGVAPSTGGLGKAV